MAVEPTLDRQRREQSKKDCEQKTKSCCFLLGIIVFSSASAVLVVWQHNKDVRMANLRVDWVYTTAFNVTGPKLSADWNMGFTISAPAVMRNGTLSFDNVACSVFYQYSKQDERFLGVTYQKLPLVLSAGNKTAAVNASVVAESILIDEYTWQYITEERSGGTVQFSVNLDAYGVTDVICFRCPVVVNYGSIDSGAGELLGGSTSCDGGSSEWCPSQLIKTYGDRS